MEKVDEYKSFEIEGSVDELIKEFYESVTDKEISTQLHLQYQNRHKRIQNMQKQRKEILITEMDEKTIMIGMLMMKYSETIDFLEKALEERFKNNDVSFVFSEKDSLLFMELLGGLILEWIAEEKVNDYQFLLEHANEVKKELPIMKLLEAYGEELYMISDDKKRKHYNGDFYHSRIDENIIVEEFKRLKYKARELGVSDDFIDTFWGGKKDANEFFKFYIEEGVLKATPFYKIAYKLPREYSDYDNFDYRNKRSLYQFLLFTDAKAEREFLKDNEDMIKIKGISYEELRQALELLKSSDDVNDNISREMYIEAMSKDTSSRENAYSKKKVLGEKW